MKNSGSNKEMFWNRLWLFVGLLPFIPSFILAARFRAPQTFFIPLYGFCPLDVLHVHSSPPPHQILIWGIVAVIISVVFAIYAFFVRPFGILFALVMWASTMGMLFKFGEF